MTTNNSSYHTLHHYLAEQHSLIKSNLKKVKKRFENNHMHDFRVAVKRFRSVDRFLQYFLERDVDKGYKHQLKHNFIHMGKVRDLRIKREWIKQLQKELESKASLKELKKALKKEEKKQQEKFLEKTRPIPKKMFKNYLEDIKADYLSFSTTDIEHRLVEFCSHIDAKIHRIKDMVDVNQWHEARKYIKILIYLGEWVGSSPHRNVMRKYDYVKMKQLTDTLGDWHDALLMHEYLQEYAELNKQEIKTLQMNLETTINSLEKKLDWNYISS